MQTIVHCSSISMDRVQSTGEGYCTIIVTGSLLRLACWVLTENFPFLHCGWCVRGEERKWYLCLTLASRQIAKMLPRDNDCPHPQLYIYVHEYIALAFIHPFVNRIDRGRCITGRHSGGICLNVNNQVVVLRK